MKTIYKYPIKIDDTFEIIMPAGSEVLTIQLQNGEPYIWVLVDPDKDSIPHTFYMLGTGHLRKGLRKENYIGTFQLADGRLVFHLFHKKDY